MDFNQQEFQRYTRHIQLPGVGTDGQKKLKQARVLIVGCGGLGAPVSLYLAAAGVGHITVVDGDCIELSNLQRQITFSEAQVGQSKAQCTQQRLLQLNSDIQVTAIEQHLSSDNVLSLVETNDLVLDCTDNFAARYLINDACKSLGKSWIYASIYQFSGQAALFTPNSTCFRCVFPNPPKDAPDCNAAGVLGVLPGLLGTLQATEALKYLLDLPVAIEGHLMLVETEDMRFQKMRLKPDLNCVCCKTINGQDKAAHFQFDPNNSDYAPACANNELSSEPMMSQIAAKDFASQRQRNDVLVVDVRENEEREAFHVGGEHIPLAELERHLSLPTLSAALAQDQTLVVYCQSGVRSQTACNYLNEQGYTALSVEGGIAQIIRF